VEVFVGVDEDQRPIITSIGSSVDDGIANSILSRLDDLRGQCDCSETFVENMNARVEVGTVEDGWSLGIYMHVNLCSTSTSVAQDRLGLLGLGPAE
jgi:hypothetical protein